MLVRSQPWPLYSGIYYYNGNPVEVVQSPKMTRPKVVLVRDLNTRMCFVVETYKLVRDERRQ
jgi:hypothetical protein